MLNFTIVSHGSHNHTIRDWNSSSSLPPHTCSWTLLSVSIQVCLHDVIEEYVTEQRTMSMYKLQDNTHMPYTEKYLIKELCNNRITRKQLWLLFRRLKSVRNCTSFQRERRTKRMWNFFFKVFFLNFNVVFFSQSVWHTLMNLAWVLPL